MSPARKHYAVDPTPVRRARRKRRLRPFKQLKRQYEVIKYDTRRYRIPLHIFFTVFLIFAGGVGTAFSFAFLQDMRRQIDSSRTAIHQQRAENIAFRQEVIQHLSKEEVSYIASTRLNMGPLDPSQIIRINVPRQSYVVQSYQATVPVPQGMWQSAFWHIRNWLGVV